jgi:hypothetical protein
MVRSRASYSKRRLGYGYGVSVASIRPPACAVAVIRRGPDASTDELCAGARWTTCGTEGAMLQRPG